jgi:hypothetical protein
MRLVIALFFLAAPLQAGKLKASFTCKKVLKDQSSWELGNEGYRIDAVRIDCVVESKSHALLEGSAVIKPLWHKDGALKQTRERHGEPIAEGPPFQYIFTLERGLDWDLCASDITFPVTVTSIDGAVIFEAKKSYRQDCAPIPVSPPVSAAKVAPEAPRIQKSELEQIPPEARELAKQFIDAVVDSDPPTLTMLAGAGVKKGKKMLKGNDAFSANGLLPGRGCDDSGTNCKEWGPWSVVKKSAGEFCLYSQNDSGYGKFPCATFTKKGGEWKWTAMTFYDTGEP